MYQRQLIPCTVVATSPYKQEAPLLVMLRRSHTCHGGLRMRVRAIRVLWRALNALHRASARLFSASRGGGPVSWACCARSFDIIGHLEKFFSPSRYESDSLTAMGHGRIERASHGADGLFRC